MGSSITGSARRARRYLSGAVRRDAGEIGSGETAAAEMDALSVEPVNGEGPSYYLRDHGSWEQMRDISCTARCIT